MWSLSDEALLAGLHSGDPEAAAGFVRRYQARVFGLALTIVGDRAVAQEVAQEAFLKAWKHAGAYDARRGQVSTWLLAITRNTAVDVTRMKRATPLDPRELLVLCEREDSEEPEDQLVVAAEMQRVRKALRALPYEQKLALIQASFYGRTAREISEEEGVPIGTVKTRIRTALLKLRTMLEANDA